MLGMCLTTGHAPHPQMLISEVVWATGALPTPDLPELVETGIWLHSLGAHHMLEGGCLHKGHRLSTR